jgi:hypothetical protein
MSHVQHYTVLIPKVLLNKTHTHKKRKTNCNHIFFLPITLTKGQQSQPRTGSCLTARIQPVPKEDNNRPRRDGSQRTGMSASGVNSEKVSPGTGAVKQ